MNCRIYLITNTCNDKVYVGRTWRELCVRFGEHKKPGYRRTIKLHNAIEKYGRDNFKIRRLVSTDNQLTADYLERFWIIVYNSISHGYNIKPGGGRGGHSEATKKKLSEIAIRQGRRPPNPNKPGSTLSEVTKQAISKRKKGKPWTYARRMAQAKRRMNHGD